MKPSVNTSKTVKVNTGLNENASNIPKAITRSKGVAVKPHRGTLTRVLSLRGKSVNKILYYIIHKYIYAYNILLIF